MAEEAFFTGTDVVQAAALIEQLPETSSRRQRRGRAWNVSLQPLTPESGIFRRRRPTGVRRICHPSQRRFPDDRPERETHDG
jgi:hypothetical protein